MDHQIKNMIVNAILKVVESAPTRQVSIYQPNVAKENFETWINYVFSILQITSQYISMDLNIGLENNIRNIATQQNVDYTTKITTICQMLLEFARKIVSL